MRVRITKASAPAWYSDHVGRTFEVHRVTCNLGRNAWVSFEVDLMAVPGDAVSGVVPADHCEVVSREGLDILFKMLGS